MWSSNNQLGCQAFPKSDRYTGAIAIVDRGGCSFEKKALNAQHAGAVAIVIANHREELFKMSQESNDYSVLSPVAIPSAFISATSGNRMKEWLARSEVIEGALMPGWKVGVSSPPSTQKDRTVLTFQDRNIGNLHVILASEYRRLLEQDVDPPASVIKRRLMKPGVWWSCLEKCGVDKERWLTRSCNR